MANAGAEKKEVKIIANIASKTDFTLVILEPNGWELMEPQGVTLSALKSSITKSISFRVSNIRAKKPTKIRVNSWSANNATCWYQPWISSRGERALATYYKKSRFGNG